MTKTSQPGCGRFITLEGIEGRNSWTWSDYPKTPWGANGSRTIATGTTLTVTCNVSTSYVAVLILDGKAQDGLTLTFTGDGKSHYVDIAFVRKSPG
jgi:hypothetical protein